MGKSKFVMGFGKRSASYYDDDIDNAKRMDPSKMKVFGFGKRSVESVEFDPDVIAGLRKFNLGLGRR